MSTTFVGREQELDELRARYRDAVGGSPQLVLVGGDAGIGKSTLVQELAEAVARDGGRVLVGACMNFGGAPPPYLPFLEALRGVAEIEVGDEQAHGESSRARLFERTLRTFEELAAEAPIVLVLEDLHWADPSTLDVLGFLVRNLRATRLLLVGTYRTDDLPRSHPLRPVLAELRRHHRTTHLGLEPFDLDEVRAQLAGLLDGVPDESVVRRVHERSDGVPFFVGELATCCTTGEGLPSSVTQVVNARLDGLDDTSRAVVEAAAIAGASVPHELLVAVTGLDEGELAASVRAAIGAAVLVVTDDGGSYSFRHALLREVVKAEMLPGDRVRLNAAVAAALGPDAAAERAWHWRQANRLADALAASLDAARAAERVYAFPEASHHYSEALELWASVGDEERPAGQRLPDVLIAGAEAAAFSGQVARSVGLVREAIEVVDAETEPEVAGSLWVHLARYLRGVGRLDESIAASETALEVLPPGPSVTRARALAGMAGVLGLRDGLARPRDLAAEAAEMAAAVGDDLAEGVARNALGLCQAAAGDFEGGAVSLERALALARRSGDLDGIARAHVNLSDTWYRAGRFEAALAVADAGGRELDRLGIRSRGTHFLEVNAAEYEIELGRWASAEARLRDADEIELTLLTEAHHQLTSARLAVRQGRLEDARARLARIEPRVIELDDAQFRSQFLHGTAELALWDGRPADALAAAVRGVEVGVAMHDAPIVAEILHLQRWALADLAELQQPVAEPAPPDGLDALLAIAGRGGELLLALGRAEGARADPEVWAAVVEVATDRPYHRAYARWRQAAALLARRQRAEAPLRDASALAEELGATRLLREVVALARRARVDLDVVEPAAADAPVSPLAGFGLTAREEEVLALLADGLSNREIGERLFINTKTASVHVSNILAKLGVGSRVQAATLATRVR